jgi:hypothetical protein
MRFHHCEDAKPAKQFMARPPVDCSAALAVALLSSPNNTDPIAKIFKTSLTPRHHDGSCPRRKRFALASGQQASRNNPAVEYKK